MDARMAQPPVRVVASGAPPFSRHSTMYVPPMSAVNAADEELPSAMGSGPGPPAAEPSGRPMSRQRNVVTPTVLDRLHVMVLPGVRSCRHCDRGGSPFFEN